MGARIGAQERLLRGRREVADFENGVEMLDRHRHRVGRIGDLADKAAVLAHGMRQPDAHAGGPAVEHFLENALVLGDSAHLFGLLERRFRHVRPHCLARRLSA